MVTTCTPVPEAVRAAFPEETVDFRVFGPGSKGLARGVKVNFINSDLGSKTPEDRRKRAEQTAGIVKSTCPEIKNLEEIDVVFTRAGGIPFIFPVVIEFDWYRFDNEGKTLAPTTTVESSNEPLPPLEAIGKDSEGNFELKPQVRYSTPNDQSEIYVEGIVLEGVPAKGLSLAPSFMLTGNAEKGTLAAPKIVNFDFASFSESSKFPGSTTVIFVSDNNYKFEGQFLKSRSADGLTSEVLYLPIPISVFEQIVKGQGLSIKLGNKEYKLSDSQFRAIQQMTQYYKKAN